MDETKHTPSVKRRAVTVWCAAKESWVSAGLPSLPESPAANDSSPEPVRSTAARAASSGFVASPGGRSD